MSFVEGLNARLARDKYDEGAPDRAMAREEAQLGLDSLRRQKSDDEERRQIVQENTTDPVVRDYDASDHPQTVDRVPRKMTFDDQLNLYEKLGEHALKTGRMDPEKSIEMKRKIKDYESEGHFDAYNEYRKTKDIKAAVKMFNSRGNSRVDPSAKIDEVQKVDPLTKMPYTAYTTAGADGQLMTFDPLLEARNAGGARGFLDSQKTAFEGRKVDVAERRAQTLEDESTRRAARDDARYETENRKLDLLEQRGGRENGGGVFGYKMGVLERAAPHLTELQRYQLASGQRNIPPAQMAKWAEDAISRQEKLTGIPMKPEERRRKVGEQLTFYRSFAEDASRPGLTPGAPSGKPRDYRNLWGE